MRQRGRDLTLNRTKGPSVEFFMMMSVDLDMPIFSVKVRDQALHRATLDRLGVAGTTTWFINDNDFALTRDHQPFLRDILDAGDAIGWMRKDSSGLKRPSSFCATSSTRSFSPWSSSPIASSAPPN